MNLLSISQNVYVYIYIYIFMYIVSLGTYNVE